ncbi:GlsB/YeaQ/YmgE family stress response membrane protein [Ornithinimicrobium cryptoxanthini]|uniref:GlsB/YeaQ/YmgE family stress response membrane protein n=1 Tax=Ornithinimicrobium cryptoxanthini TaxID=2934161 RepID=UPI002117D989|nr:GlsB/YeaQ/YmgE family stress response membrane protein [Ornithinimicrobium cryptoxanthini]
MIWTIISALILGCIIGPLARLILPGKQNISLPITILIGAVGALLGSWLYTLLSGNEDTSGIDWIALGLGVVVAIVLVLIYGAVTGKDNTHDRLR